MQLNNNDLLIVLTVGSFGQKQLCEKFILQLDLPDINIRVICDDELGVRLGSGGALLNAVDKYYGVFKKIIIINCGGFSKRTVSCAVKGKAFTQVLISNKPITLFELILDNALLLSGSFDKGVLIACSDILIDSTVIKTDFTNNIVFGVAADLQTASQHGVIIKGENNELSKFLHKVDISSLKQFAFKETEQIIVDTGMAFLNDSFVLQLLNLTRNKGVLELIKTQGIELNFYSDVSPLLSRDVVYSDYIGDDCRNSARVELKDLLYNYLCGYSFNVCVVDDQPFLHFGNNEQLRKNTVFISDISEKYLKINSFLNLSTKVGFGTVFDNVCLYESSYIGSGCMISDIRFNQPVEIKDNSVVCGIRLKDGNFVTIITDISENPKDLINDSTLWNLPRFYKASSFDDSLKKFIAQTCEDKVSIKYCVDNADYNYFLENKQYINGLICSTYDQRYLNVRRNIIEEYFKRKIFPDVFCSKCDSVNISMPVRVNLSGTWSDAMPYCVENGGTVINVAATTDGIAPIKVRLEKLNSKVIEFFSDDIQYVFSFDDVSDMDEFSDFNLHKSVLKTVGIINERQLENGFRLITKVERIDKGSGLGTSSILLSACFKALSEMFGLNYTDSEIVEMVFIAEQIMKTGGGWQDQVGGLFSGIKMVSSDPGILQKVKIETIEIPDAIQYIFNKKAVLLPTGQRHFGRFVVNDVANRYLNKNPETISAYAEIKKLNESLLKAIKNSNITDFYNCINVHMQLLKQISPLVTNSKIDRIVQRCMSISNAISICGAGAGGYLLAFLKDEISVDDCKQFFYCNFPEIKSEVLKLDIFSEGVNDEQ